MAHYLTSGHQSPSRRLLKTNMQDVFGRHRSLWSAIEWSYALLSKDEQALFRRLAIFPGGWTLDAAAAICCEGLPLDPFDDIMSLVDKHLAQRMESTDEMPRWMMLETLREFGQEQLRLHEDSHQIQRLMASYYVQFSETIYKAMKGDGYIEGLRRMQAEHPNLRAVFQWSLDKAEVEYCLRLVAATHFFHNSHPKEGDRNASAAINLAEDFPPNEHYVNGLITAGYSHLGKAINR